MAKYVPDIKGGINALFVYAPNLVEMTALGNKFVPILRIANVRGETGQLIEDIYIATQYHRIIPKEISEISIEIRTSTGRLVPFNYGDCILTLHFRKLSLF